MDWKASLERYIQRGVPTGQCLAAALTNDLLEFVGRADPETLADAKAIVTFVHCSVPWAARGSREKVSLWCEAGGLEGKAQRGRMLTAGPSDLVLNDPIRDAFLDKKTPWGSAGE